MVERKLALVIGNNYPNSDKELKFAVADATKIKEVLENKNICGFDEVKSLLNSTSVEASSAVEKILKNADKDLVLIYFSGHGKKDFENSLCLLFNNTEEDSLVTTSLTFDSINKFIRYPSRKLVIIVLDCCYSGVAGIRYGDTDVTEDLRKLSGSGTIILTSTGSNGSSIAREDEKLGHGIFTYYLIEGLEKSYADKDDDGYISIDDLYKYAFEMTVKRGLQSPKKEGRIEGTAIIGKNLLKIKEKEYKSKREKLFKEYSTQFPPSVFSESQTILRKDFENSLPLEEADAILRGFLDTLLKDDLLPEKRSDAIQNYIEALQLLKGISINDHQKKWKEEAEQKRREEEEKSRREREEQERIRRQKEEAEQKRREEERKKKEKEDLERKQREEEEKSRREREEQERIRRQYQEKNTKRGMALEGLVPGILLGVGVAVFAVNFSIYAFGALVLLTVGRAFYYFTKGGGDIGTLEEKVWGFINSKEKFFFFWFFSLIFGTLLGGTAVYFSTKGGGDIAILCQEIQELIYSVNLLYYVLLAIILLIIGDAAYYFTKGGGDIGTLEEKVRGLIKK